MLKKTQSTTVKLPTLFVAGMEPQKGNTKDDFEELNLLSYAYAKRSAIPTLDDYIITPFDDTFKGNVYDEAVKLFGLDRSKILKGDHKISMNYNGILFVARAFRTNAPDLDLVMQTIISELEQAPNDPKYPQVDGKHYLNVSQLLLDMDNLKKDSMKRGDKTEVKLIDPATNKGVSLDTKITQLDVPLDSKVFTDLNASNAQKYFLAKSLRKRLSTFGSAFEDWAMKQNGIKGEGLEYSKPIPVALSDGQGARYLFYPKSARPPAGDMYDALAKNETAEIGYGTGDLHILAKLKGFKTEPLKTKNSACSLLVKYKETGERLGVVSITKIYETKKITIKTARQYHVMEREGVVYAQVADVLQTVLKVSDRLPQTEVKIDFFPAAPAYLR